MYFLKKNNIVMLLMTSDNLWYKNPKLLYENDRYLDFWPSKDKSYNNNINAFSRFIIYCGITLSIYHKDTIGIVCALVLLIFMYFSIDIDKDEHKIVDKVFNDQDLKADRIQNCQQPTKNNPFSNFLIGDDVNKKSACEYVDVKCDVDKKFNSDIYKSVWDVFDKQNSQRQFYSMPNTKIVNEQTSFAEWLYGPKFKKSCKTDFEVCTGHEVGGASSGFGAGA